MLHIENLHVKVNGKEILKGVNLHIKKGETHVLFGPNGAGKTTLLMTLMRFEDYKITEGKIYFKNEDITNLKPYQIAKKGIGIMFQRPPTIQGVKMREILEILNKKDTGNFIKNLNMENFLNRDLNDGFSGGEIKRSEILQLLLQDPELVLIDEPDSGVDLENIHIVGDAINILLEKNKNFPERKKSGLMITHAGYILDYVDADVGHIFIDGKIVCSGNPRDMFKEIRKEGYERCAECRRNF